MDIALETAIEELRQSTCPHPLAGDDRCCDLLMDGSILLDYADCFRRSLKDLDFSCSVPETLGSIHTDPDGHESFLLNIMSPLDYPSQVYAHVFAFVAALSAAYERVANAVKCWYGLPENMEFRDVTKRIACGSPIGQLLAETKQHVGTVESHRNAVIHKNVFLDAYTELREDGRIKGIAFLMPDNPSAARMTFSQKITVTDFVERQFHNGHCAFTKLVRLLKRDAASRAADGQG